MEYEAVAEFLSAYEGLADQELRTVGQILGQLEAGHETRWARQGRIRGDAWIIIEDNWRLYWAYQPESTILLLALIRRDIAR